MRLALPFVLLLAAGAAEAATIGLSLPLSGRYAPIGRQIEIGVLKAIEDHVRQGGARPEIAPVDDACGADNAADNAAQMRERGAEVVIGVPCFDAAFALARLFADKQVPVLGVGIRHPETRDRVAEGLPLWIVGPDGEAEAKAIADLVLARWRDTPFALLDDGSVYGRALSDALRALAEERGLRPLEVASFRPLQSNQAALVRRLARTGVEAIFVAGDAEDAATFSRDAARVAPGMEVATGETGALVPFLELSPANGMLVVARPARRDHPRASILVERMENDGLPPDDGILEGYALAQVALNVLDGRTVAGTVHETVIGDLSFGTDHRAVSAPFALMRWNGSRLALRDGAAEAENASPAQ